jgi:cobalt-zinc-cadmium efflux system protein
MERTMSPSHDHHGSPDPRRSSVRRALTWALVLNGAFLIVEAGIGLMTGSLALLSDAAHMVSDVAALALALGAASLATRAADPRRSYGFRRAEVLGAGLNGLAMLIVVGLIAKEAVIRLFGESPEVLAWPVLVAGAAGLAINLGSAWWLARADRDNLNVRGALVHMLADALGSVGAMVAAVGLWLGWPAADALVALFVAVLVLWGTVRLLRDTISVLMEFAPAGEDGQQIGERLSTVDGVAGVHDVHLWTLDGRERLLTAHLVLREGARAEDILRDANVLLAEEHGVHHATLQVEPAGTCAQDCCSLQQGVYAGAPGRAHA